MPRRPSPKVADLRIPRAARFLVLPKALTKTAVDRMFDAILLECDATAVAREVRKEHMAGAIPYFLSFLCFRTTPPVPFLAMASLREVRFGYVLLLERNGHLVAFHRSSKGLDDLLAKTGKAVSRSRLTHLWNESARYQKMSTRRMTIAKEELRGASYEADDLETAFVPALAARSILQTIRLASPQHGSVGVTPGTGRVRLGASKAALVDLVTFVDATLQGIASVTDSSFLGAFPEPVELDNLPTNIEPVGLLFDVASLHELLYDPLNPATIRAEVGAEPPDEMLRGLAQVLMLQRNGTSWEGVDEGGKVIVRVQRLTDSYSAAATVAKAYTIEHRDGTGQRLDRWLRSQAAFSLTFSSTEYFYTGGHLYRKAGFAQDVAQIERFLKPNIALSAATSEKGDGYQQEDSTFKADSIFAIVEATLAASDSCLWCCDLGDEWADFIGVADRGVTFYHCKHGTSTTGASDFQVVVAQALKNLGRVKYRQAEMQDKIQGAQKRSTWGTTSIPLLVKSAGGWTALQTSLNAAIADPNTKWNVALVVTALSYGDFKNAASEHKPKPHFVQLVWLLSAFISACRERDAQPCIICKP